MMTRRGILAGSFLMPFGLKLAAQPQSTVGPAETVWQPARPIRMIVAYPAGGPTDVIARIVAHELSESLGQNIFVENISGASGALGTRQVARAAPDGLTLTFGNNQTHGNNMFMLREPGYDALKDFSFFNEPAL